VTPVEAELYLEIFAGMVIVALFAILAGHFIAAGMDEDCDE
jgi:hypothetical protein